MNWAFGIAMVVTILSLWGVVAALVWNEIDQERLERRIWERKEREARLREQAGPGVMGNRRG